MTTIYREARLLHGYAPALVFHVQLASARTIFMSALDESQTYAVVEVSAVKLLTAWRRTEFSPHLDVANGDANTWPNDAKYASADRSFAIGLENPVPVPLVAIERQGVAALPVLNFIDGITRTIWLLANGADSFPVKCPLQDAHLLVEACGAIGHDSLVQIPDLSAELSPRHGSGAP